MINQYEIDDILYSIPSNVDYTTILDEVDIEDIPYSRIEKLIYMVDNCSEFTFFQTFKAGVLLCHWGVKKGFQYIRYILLSYKCKSIRNNILEAGDYKYILSAIQSYLVSIKSGYNNKEDIKSIYFCMKIIISYAKKYPFDISGIYYLIYETYREFVPLIKDYLESVIYMPDKYYWQISDSIKLLLKLEPDYIRSFLEKNRKKLSDFSL